MDKQAPPPSADSTLRDLILWAEARLQQSDVVFGHGTDNALDEAAWLVSGAIGLSADFDDSALANSLSAEQVQKVDALLTQRIAQHIPTAYLLHQAWFAGYPFYVDQRVLVPRSPFAELIHHGFQPWVDSDKLTRILDLCCGSGCIGIACALHLPQVQVDVADISADALQVVEKNIEHYELQQRVTCHHSDLFASLGGERYDLIVCNPPYVDAVDMAALPAEYHIEPGLGLAAGEDGLELVLPILQQAAEYLTHEGVLMVEVGNSEAALVERFAQVPFTWLEFALGGEGVFTLDAVQLKKYRDVFLAG